ncbi:sensor domain-containing diguanylate cyclase [Pseudomonas mangiferae]|nr:diguanylate cyclase [Pseudomonas mangiferae]
MSPSGDIRPGSPGFVSPSTPAWLIGASALAIGLLLTAGVVATTRHFYQDQLRQRFLWAADERAEVLQDRFDAHTKDLDGLRRFLVHPEHLQRSEFALYVDPLLDTSLAYSWIPRVLDEARPAFEEAGRREGIGDFAIRDLQPDSSLRIAGQRSEYLPILYSATRRIKRVPLGLDLMAQPTRRLTLERARERGDMALSDPLILPGANPEDNPGLLLLAPVYPPFLASSGELRALPLGYVSAVFSLRRLMSEGGSRDTEANLALVLTQAGAGASDTPIYRSTGAPSADRTLSVRKTLAIADRRFYLDIRPTDAFLAANQAAEPWLAFAGGLWVSALLAALLYTLASQRRRALLLVEERTAALRQRERELQQSEQRWQFALESAGDGVWDWNIETGEIYHSAAWRQSLGYSETETSLGLEAWRQRMHPQDRADYLDCLQAHLDGLTPDYRHEHRIQRRDGSWIWILERGKVLEFDRDGAPRRMVGTHVDISRRKAAEMELARAHGQLRGILDSATEFAIIAVDPSGLILTFNIGAERMLGYSTAELAGLASIERLHLWSELQNRSQDLARQLGHPVVGFEALVARAAELDDPEAGEWTYVRRDGSTLTVNLIVTAIRDGSDALGFLCIARDVSEEKRVREILLERDRLLEKLTLWLPGAIYQFQREADGSFRFPYASVGIRDVYECTPDVLREDAGPAFSRLHPDDHERFMVSIDHSAQHLTTWHEDYRVLLPSHGLRWLRGQAAPERLADGKVLWHGYLADITGLKQVEQELRALSITDALTGVFNRRYFNERLDAEIGRAQRHGQPLALVMLDIDYFKRINDRAGHSAGDLVLKDICQRLAQRLRRIDSLCRLGGEEFVVLCPDTDLGQATILAEALRQAIRREPVEGVGEVTASFGVAAWTLEETADTLLRRADEAVYAAKQGGRDQVVASDLSTSPAFRLPDRSGGGRSG